MRPCAAPCVLRTRRPRLAAHPPARPALPPPSQRRGRHLGPVQRAVRRRRVARPDLAGADGLRGAQLPRVRRHQAGAGAGPAVRAGVPRQRAHAHAHPAGVWVWVRVRVGAQHSLLQLAAPAGNVAVQPARERLCMLGPLAAPGGLSLQPSPSSRPHRPFPPSPPLSPPCVLLSCCAALALPRGHHPHRDPPLWHAGLGALVLLCLHPRGGAAVTLPAQNRVRRRARSLYATRTPRHDAPPDLPPRGSGGAFESLEACPCPPGLPARRPTSRRTRCWAGPLCATSCGGGHPSDQQTLPPARLPRAMPTPFLPARSAVPNPPMSTSPFIPVSALPSPPT